MDEIATRNVGVRYFDALERSEKRTLEVHLRLNVGFEQKVTWGVLALVMFVYLIMRLFDVKDDTALPIFFIMGGLSLIGALGNELSLWRMRRKLAEFDRRQGRSEAEQKIVDNPFDKACYDVYNAAICTTSAIGRWNAYTDRLALGTTERFNGDLAVRDEIIGRHAHMMTMDALVARLSGDEWRTRNGNEYVGGRLDAAALSQALDRLDLTEIRNADTWLMSLVERHPQLA